jgi:hypothetical protein
MKYVFLFFALILSKNLSAIEALDGFLVTAYDERFRVVSPDKFRSPMEIVVENSTLVRLIGKVVINQKTTLGHCAIEPGKYYKFKANLKKGDILHFIPLSPAFQEVELIVGNKNYEIPPKK